MDENYLDNLLNEISLDREIDHKIEDELDSQMRTEKQKRQAANEVTKEEAFNLDIENESLNISDPLDLRFSEEQMEELDALDNLADLDIGDLDFADIDFDDLDMTRLDDLDDESFEDLLKDFEGDLEIDDFFNRGGMKTKNSSAEEQKSVNDSESDIFDDIEKASGRDELADEAVEAVSTEEETLSQDVNEAADDAVSDEDNVSKEVPPEELNQKEIDDLLRSVGSVDDKEDLNEDSFDANNFLDSLLSESQEEEAASQPLDELDAYADDPDFIAGNVISSSAQPEEKEESFEESLEDLLGSLEDAPSNGNEPQNNESSGLEEISDLDALLSMDNVNTAPKEDTGTALSSGEADDLDDLLAMLDEEGGETPDTGEQEKVEKISAADKDEAAALLDELDGIQKSEAVPAKKKKTLMEILFGSPDEDDEFSKEELEEFEAKKAEKKAAKAAKKEAAKKEKEENNKAKKAQEGDKKKKAAEEKNRLKAEKKAKRKAEEAANAEPEKKLNKPMVVFVFTLFLGGVFLFYVGTNNFNYTQAIEKAANYFTNQKYRRAYDEIAGVEVKEKDQDLKNRIYTVMYVERLYESYNNNIQMGHEEKALDSLLRGVTKYYEHYEDAQELGIVSDLDYSFNQIRKALSSRYGISVEQAVDINAMDNLEYVKTINQYVSGVAVDAGENTSNTEEENTDGNTVLPDAVLPSEDVEVEE